MSYLVLARKCRPQNFDEVAAQEHITETLKKAITKDRISHSYLFCGPRGTGKTTMARILAKALNCQSFSAPTPTPCGECESCVSVAASRNADVLEIDGASNRGVQEIQALRERVQYAPRGRFKVFIIDEVHMLTKEAFNALLKTLEEPPERVVFIFATTEPHKLPSTIISRCQRYDFRRIPTDVIAERIKTIAKAEGLLLSDDAAFIIAQRADGGLRDSLSLLDQILAYSPKGELSSDEVAAILGVLPLDAFAKISKCIADENPACAIKELDVLLESGIDITQVASGLSMHFHGALMAAIGVDQEGVSEKALKEYARFAEKIDTADILRMAKLASGLQAKLKSSGTPRFLLEQTLIYIATIDSTADIRKVIVESKNEAPITLSQSSPRLRPEAEVLVNDSEVPETTIDPQFNRIIKLFESSRGEGKAEMLRQARFILDEGRVIFKFPHSFKFQVDNILKKKENLDELSKAVTTVLGEGTRIKLSTEESPAPSTEGHAKSTKKEIPEGVISLLSAFDAKIEN
ncbi:DNA polymerase III subunit gamma/tau [bacterium]|nr:DNA polymerase III subunit gamma/tau [bacterium]